MRSTSFALGLGLAALTPIWLSSCQSSSGSSAPSEAPTNLSYGTNFLDLENCVTITPLVPTFEGGAPSLFEVAPPLPEGLALDPVTGVISGTLFAPTGTTLVTVTASNAVGSTSTDLTFQVSDPTAPTGLAYGTPQASYTVGVPVAANTPTVDGPVGGTYTFAVAPPLPPGLSLDPDTGTISGVPSAATGAAAYSVRATDCVGQTATGKVVIEVGGGSSNPQVPNGLVVANSDGTLSMFKVDPVNGRTQPFGYALLGDVPADLVVGPEQTELYTLLRDKDLVAVTPLDATGVGFLPPVSPPYEVPGLGRGGELAVSPSGQALYVSDSQRDQVHALAIGSFGSFSPLPGSPLQVDGSGIGGQSPTELAVAEDGSLLFVTNHGSNTVSAIQIAGDGSLGAQTAASTGAGPEDVATVRLANGRTIVFVTNAEDATVSVFEADAAAPSLTLLQTLPLPSGSFPEKLAVVRAGGKLFLYISKTATELVVPVEIDPNVGTVSGPLNVLGQGGVVDFAFANNGAFGFLGLGEASGILPLDIAPADGGLSPVVLEGTPQDCIRSRPIPISTVLVHSAAPKRLRTRNVYTANADSADVAQYAYQPDGFSMSALSPADQAVGVRPVDVAVPNGGLGLFAADSEGFASDDLFQLPISAGALGAPVGIDLGASTSSQLSGARAVAVDPSSRFAFVTRDGGPGVLHGYRVDGFGGFEASFTDGAANGPRDCLAEPTGRFVYVANRFGDLVSQHRIDPFTGSLSLVSTAATGNGPVALATDAGGCRLFVLLAGTGQIQAFAVNPTSGVLTQLGFADGAGSDATAIAVDPSGGFLVTADAASGQLVRYAISDGSGPELPGVPVALGTTGAGGIPSDLAFDNDGSVLFVTLRDTGNVRRFRVGAEAGTLTLLGDSASGAAPSSVAVRNVVE